MTGASHEAAATAPGRAAYDPEACSICGGPLTAGLAASPEGDCQGDETGADTERRLREQRDSLTGRVAELVTENGELRGQVARAHAETRSFLARIDALARELEASSKPGKLSTENIVAKRLRAITGTDPAIDPPAGGSPDGGGGREAS